MTRDMLAADGSIVRLSTADLPRTQQIERFLSEQGTFEANPLPNGLFPAAGTERATREALGYHYVWVRDNVHLAHWLLATGREAAATRTVRALLQYFSKHEHRFLEIIAERADPGDPMVRPHIRFDGRTLEEVDQAWPHKQNDALGYLLWLACNLIRSRLLNPSSEELATLALFPHFFQAIRYWEDKDSGHWEETEKIEASSIGVALAGVAALGRLQQQAPFDEVLAGHGVTRDLIEELDAAGRRALAEILPYECIQQGRERNSDAALLFLICPTEIVKEASAEAILRGVREQLQGEIGIARYHGDTFWAPNYKELVPKEERTAFVGESDARNLITTPRGEEAQWCLFDSIVSTIYGRRFLEHRRHRDLELQIEYLNRSLGQLTRPSPGLPAYRCPEAYYLEHGRWVPNDATPLLWAQANLQLALRQAEASASSAMAREGDPPVRS